MVGFHDSRVRDIRMDESMRKTTLAVLAAAALALTGCTAVDTALSKDPTSSSHSSSRSQESVEAASEGAPKGFKSYYTQEVTWRQCESDEVVSSFMSVPSDMESYQCTTLKAPMNWEDPDSEEIELGVARYVPGRDGESRDPLFFNLGGPGGGAVDSLASAVENIFPEKILRNFQVIALDPRGVGTSTPIQCLTDEERDEEERRVEDLSELTTEELVVFYEDEMGSLGEKCLERSGDLLGYVDSTSVARDFDMVRSALGFEKFDYVGYSYGTLLGAIYADLFPTRVGHFVLDGVLDPAMDVNEVSEAQLDGMESSLYHWIEYCQEQDECPFPGDLEQGKEELSQFLEDVAEDPIPTADPDRPLNINLAYTAIIGSLYSTDSYSFLVDGIDQAMEGDGSMLLFLADYFNDRDVDGTYLTNSDDAFTAVNNLDYQPVGTPEEWEAASERLSEAYPILGEDFGFASAGLSKWPVQSTTPRVPITAEDAPEMLLIGTTHDPATPYVMAENLHGEIGNSVLLTVEGWDHTAYSRSASKCVQNIVNAFLLKGELPEDGVVCD